MHAKDLIVTGNARVLGTLQTGEGKFSIEGHTHNYLPLSGGTMTGCLTTVGSKWVETSSTTSAADFTRCGLNMANSDIIGCNALYFQDSCDSATEGIHFYSSDTAVHTIWVNSSGTLYYTPSRTLNTQSTTGKFSVSSSGEVSATSYNANSDKRLKENIRDYSCNKSILELPVYKYNFIEDKSKQDYIGCLAQDLQEICPELVHTKEDGYLAIEESKIVYLLLEEVKKLRLEVDELKAKN